jgi:polysaccharide biosynthesis/export protein
MYSPTLKAGFLLVATFAAIFAGELLAQDSTHAVSSSPGAPATQSGVTARPDATPPATGAQPGSELLIGSGDLLEVSVYGASDFSKIQARVGTDGTITLPLVGSLKIAGLNNHDAEALIGNALSKHRLYNEPQVSVLTKEYGTQGISVLGEVAKPGIYPLFGPHRLFDAISVAGGTTAVAGQTVTITHRGQPRSPERVNLSYGDDGAESNVMVYPGDTIIISRAGVVYVVGDVKLPSGIVLQQRRLTVLQALAMAQGANSTAKLSEAKLIHRSPQGPEETPLNLKQILAAKAPDPVLQAEDIVFVPANAGKKVATRTLDAIISTASGVAIYRP